MTRADPSRLRRLAEHRWAAPGVLLGLMAVGAMVRFAVARQELFADELATYWIVSTRGLTGVVETVSTTAEITPPLSFLLSWISSRLGSSPELVRLPALIAGIASIPLVYSVGARTVGRGAALLAAALTTLSPFMIFYSAEARGYAVLMALVLLSTLAMLIAVERGGMWWWVLYGASVCLAAYTHYTAVYVLAAQLAWALWTQPRSRTPLLVATGSAALLFAPWLPSLKGDLDSPTAVILGALSPVDGHSMRLALGQWSVGFPAANFGVALPFDVSGSSLRDLPGTPALVLLAASACVGAVGAFTMRTRLRGWFADRGGRLTLVLLLAVASPVGAAVQSAVGTNVFRTRTFAASWPYLALAAAALVTIGRPALRVIAAALAVTAFAVATITMLGDDFHRPGYRTAARQGAQPGGVIVNGAAYTPGPLTDFDVEGAIPDSPVLRVNVPEQMETPFTLTERRPDPADVAERAVAAADGGPITVISFIPELPVVTELVDHLPPDYELTDTSVIPGILDLEVRVYEREGPTAGS